MLIFCWIASLFVNSILLTKASASSCADGYIYYEAGETCIKIVNTSETWDQAKATCEADNGNLLIIHNEEQNTFVNQKLNTKKFYWIGTRNENPKAFDFVNVDGKKMSYNNWKTGMPDNAHGNELCVMIYGNKRINSGDWNDYGCHRKLPFLCERQLENEKIPSVEEEISCDSGYTLYHDGKTCMKAFKNILRWGEAKSFCEEEENGHLVIIDSEEKNKFVADDIMNTTTTFAWIGVQSKNADSNDFVDVDGKKMTYTNWRVGQPTNTQGYDRCGVMFGITYIENVKYHWDAKACSMFQGYVCEREPIVQTKKEDETGCGESYVHYPDGDTCIRLVKSIAKWNDAQRKCKADGGDLLVIHDAQENAFVTDNLLGNGATYVWIGGQKRNSEGFEFYTVDGKEMTYNNWRLYQPDNLKDSEVCVGMYGKKYNDRVRGRWDDSSCTVMVHFLCERAPVGKEVASSCPEGWSEYQEDNTCVKVFESRKNFEKAREVCKGEGGDLVTIKDEKKNSFVKEKLGRLRYWIGLVNRYNKKGKKGFDFKYLDDTKMGSYHPWQKGEPNNARKRQHCVLMDGSRKKGKYLGLWNDYKCHKRLGFVCEVSK